MFIVQERYWKSDDDYWYDHPHAAEFERKEDAIDYCKGEASCHSAYVYRVVERIEVLVYTPGS